MGDKDMLNAEQAAEIVGCHRNTINRAAKLGELKATKVGRAYIILRSDLIEWLSKGGFNPKMRRE